MLRPWSASAWYHVHILAGVTGVLYTAVTNDLERRVMQHKQKLLEGFTKEHEVTRLVYFEPFNEIKSAIRREKQEWHREDERQRCDTCLPVKDQSVPECLWGRLGILGILYIPFSRAFASSNRSSIRAGSQGCSTSVSASHSLRPGAKKSPPYTCSAPVKRGSGLVTE